MNISDPIILWLAILSGIVLVTRAFIAAHRKDEERFQRIYTNWINARGGRIEHVRTEFRDCGLNWDNFSGKSYIITWTEPNGLKHSLSYTPVLAFGNDRFFDAVHPPPLPGSERKNED